MAGASLATRAPADENFIMLDNNAGIRAVVAPAHGGELSSFQVLFDGHWHELLYRAMDYGDQPGWRGKAPLLWPATGISLHPDAGIHYYALAGTHYPMPFHGFARHQRWRVLERPSQDRPVSLVVALSENPDTRKYYPFDFELTVEYRLGRDKLSMIYAVEAGENNSGPMPFSIGNHITFKAPLIEGGDATAVRFHTDLPAMLLRNPDKTFSGDVVPSPFQGWHSLAALPVQQAVSLGGSPGSTELQILDPSGLQLRLAHHASSEPLSPSIRFNLWANTEAGFFSPEPWLGLQNSLNSGAGLVKLMPGETWTWQIDIIPSRAPKPGEAPEDPP
jgi:galactose mutarotase-like enzyme